MHAASLATTRKRIVSPHTVLPRLRAMEIVKVTRQQVDSAMSLIADASRTWRGGIHQWDDVYPSREMTLADIEERKLYSAVGNDDLMGIVAFDTVPNDRLRIPS